MRGTLECPELRFERATLSHCMVLVNIGLVAGDESCRLGLPAPRDLPRPVSTTDFSMPSPLLVHAVLLGPACLLFFWFGFANSFAALFVLVVSLQYDLLGC